MDGCFVMPGLRVVDAASAAGRVRTERVVTAATASVDTRDVLGFAMGRCGAGEPCLGSLGDALEVFTD